jgi:excisionase family DNA binding protein
MIAEDKDNIRYTTRTNAWTVEEIAELIRATPRFVYSEIDAGRLVARKLSSRLIRVMPTDLKRWLDAAATLTISGGSRL